MKKFLILIFGVLVAVPAICQLDSLPNMKGGLYWIPQGMIPVKEPDFRLLKFKLNQASSVVLHGGYAFTYIPESDDHESNKLGARIRLIVQQVPYNTAFTNEQMQQITDLINSFVSPPAPPPVIVTETIDNVVSETKNKYTGAWFHPTVQGHFNNSISWSCVTGSTLETTFEGNEITWITEKLSTHGLIAVTIDNGPETTVDLYSAEHLKKQVVFNRSGLANGPHTIKLRITGNKNPDSKATCLVHDYFEVKKVQ